MFLLHFCKNWNRFIHIYVFASEIKYRYSNVASFSTLPFRPHSRAAHLARCLCCAFPSFIHMDTYSYVCIHNLVYIQMYICTCMLYYTYRKSAQSRNRIKAFSRICFEPLRFSIYVSFLCRA